MVAFKRKVARAWHDFKDAALDTENLEYLEYTIRTFLSDLFSFGVDQRIIINSWELGVFANLFSLVFVGAFFWKDFIDFAFLRPYTPTGILDPRLVMPEAPHRLSELPYCEQYVGDEDLIPCFEYDNSTSVVEPCSKSQATCWLLDNFKSQYV